MSSGVKGPHVKSDGNTMNRSGLLRSAVLILVFAALIVATRAAAEIYKWVDENGRTHYSDRPPQTTQSPDDIQKIRTDDIIPQTSVHYDDGGHYDEDSNNEESRDRRMHKVELYVTSWCPYCKKARAFFMARGIPVTEYDIEKDREAAGRKQRLDSRRGVPFAVVNGHKIHGYVPAAYELALRGE